MKTKFILALAIISSLSFTPATVDLKNFWKTLLNQVNFDQSMQSFCYDEEGTIYGDNIDLQVKPASVSKLYTTLWGLDSLGKDFHFQTKFTVKNNNLYIVGGSDPFFVTENLFQIMDHLAQQGFNSFDKVYFSENFFFNWSDSAPQIIGHLRSILNTDKWSQYTQETFAQTNDYIRKHTLGNELVINHFQVNQIISIPNIRLLSGDYSFLYRSSPLWEHLKQVNMYSNNFYADKLFGFLGGSSDFSDYLYKKIGATNNEIYFYTGSGLGANYTTCRITLEMLNALEEVANREGLELSQFIAVPGHDDGTLKKRFAETQYKGKLAAKTGTLHDTSTLAGYLFSSPATTKFGVFNHTDDRVKARELQNALVKKSIDLYTNIQTLNYQTPDYLSILDTEITEIP